MAEWYEVARTIVAWCWVATIVACAWLLYRRWTRGSRPPTTSEAQRSFPEAPECAPVAEWPETHRTRDVDCSLQIDRIAMRLGISAGSPREVGDAVVAIIDNHAAMAKTVKELRGRPTATEHKALKRRASGLQRRLELAQGGRL